MTPRFKDFGNGNDGAIVEPLSFKLHDTEFLCYPELQGKVLLDMASMVSDAGGAGSAAVLLKFFEKALTPKSKVDFDEMLLSTDKIVKIEMLGEITTWLIAEYSNRPQQGPELSAPGQ